MRSLTRTTLDEILNGDWPSEAELLRLIATVAEDEHCELKGAFPTPKEAAREIRRELAGFANTDGGFLVLGVADDRQLVGWPKFGSTSQEDWVTRSTTALLPFLLRAPKARTYTIQGRVILLVAVDRATSLVPVVDGSEDVYFIRSGDSSVSLHGSVAADLLLGRRASPRVALRTLSVSIQPTTGLGADSSGGNAHVVSINVAIRNASLVPAERVTIGAFYWSAGGPTEFHGDEILRYIDAEEPGPEATRVIGGQRWQLRHRPELKTVPFTPFLEVPWTIEGMTLPAGPPVQTADVHLAAYVVPWNAPPSWFQLHYRWSLQDKTPLPGNRISTEAVFAGKPRVAWRPL